MRFEEALLLERSTRSKSWNSRENKNYNHHKYHWEENDDSFKSGRERLVSVVCNRVRKAGKYIDRNTVRTYIYKISSLKLEERPEWIQKITEKARDLGFDPENDSDHTNVTKGKEGYKGRAYYFYSLQNGYTNHFLGKKEGKKSK